MRISETEQKVLFDKKLKEGKLPLQASFEVRETKQFVNDISKDNNKLKSELTKAYQTIQELKEKIIKMEPSKNETFKKAFNQLQKGTSENTNLGINASTKFATTKVLSRVLLILEDSPRMNVTDLAEACLTNNDIIKDALMFLLRNKFVKEERLNGGYLYSKI